eukprot:TRINITY_DN66239_c0_g1_i1.p1 TRINITY_DN66239_c0_g1~~TRINITY_DN66239_c0_g1_i1.p1  ORF type:complete len:355 (-),score=51.45 TRINITY_DN66239_c0_g1_i1:59-1123(-)
MTCVLHGIRRPRPRRAPGEKKPTVADFYSVETPAFLVGPGTGKLAGGLGPGACFGSIDNGDDTQGLSQLERRLYHPEAMPEARARRTALVTRQMAEEDAAAAATAGQRGKAVRQSASSPSLGSGSAPSSRPPATAKSRGAGAAVGRGRSAPRTGDWVPYPCSEARSETSEWKKQFVADAPPGLYARGLLANDITYAHASTPGVCTLREMTYPTIGENDEGLQTRVDNLNQRLKRQQDMIAEQRAAMDRPPSVGGSSQGQPCEMLPRCQARTSGRAALCRPLPADLHSSDKRGRYALAEDSLTTSEHRSNFWWKDCTSEQREELKQFGRPLDNWVLFRDNAVKIKDASRYPINTY